MTDHLPTALAHRPSLRRWLALALAGALATVLGGCADSPTVRSIKDTKIPGVYRLPVQQGNVLDAEAVSKLEVGMTKRKVSYLAGTPAIRDTFNQDRWDYVYTYKPGGGEREQRKISLFFEGEKLTRILGELPPEDDTKHRASEERVVDVPPESRKRSFVSSINPWSDDGKVVKKKAKEPATDQTAPAERPAEFEAPANQDTASDATPSVAAAHTETETTAPADATTDPSDNSGEPQKSLFDRLSDRFSLSAPSEQSEETVPADR